MKINENANEAAHRHYRKRKLLDLENIIVMFNHNSNHWTLVVGGNLIDRWNIHVYILNLHYRMLISTTERCRTMTLFSQAPVLT